MRFLIRYSWESSQKRPPRTSFAASCLLRLMPAGDSVRMAWAISGRAHKAWMVSLPLPEGLGIARGVLVADGDQQPGPVRVLPPLGAAGRQAVRAAKSSFRSMKRPKTCWKSFIYLWVAEAGFWR